MTARRLAIVAWIGMTLLCLGSAVASRGTDGHYAGHAVRIRPWMVTYNSFVDLFDCIGLLLFSFAALRLPKSSWRAVALAGFGAALLLVLAHITLPLWLGSGAWNIYGWQLRVIRALIFAPSFCRDVGCAALALALLPRRFSLGVLALVGADALLIAIRWARTPIAVMSMIHPFCTNPIGLCFWLLAFGVFVFSASRLSSSQ